MKFPNYDAFVWLIVVLALLSAGILIGLIVSDKAIAFGNISSFISAASATGLLITAVLSYQKWRTQKVAEAMREDASKALKHILPALSKRNSLRFNQDESQAMQRIVSSQEGLSDITVPETELPDTLYAVANRLKPIIESLIDSVESALAECASINSEITDELSDIHWRLKSVLDVDHDTYSDIYYKLELAAFLVANMKQGTMVKGHLFLSKHSLYKDLKLAFERLDSTKYKLQALARFQN